jgi:ABC-type multidrug transport system ATPase subunit
MEAIALLAAGKPVLYFLDEPIAGVDIGSRHLLCNWIREEHGQGTSFIIVEHEFVDFLPWIDYAMILQGMGVSYWGRANALLDRAKLAEVYL